MTKDEVLAIIFTPNFSTKEEASMFSGRGVGMSAIKEKADQYQSRVLRVKVQL